MSKQQLRIINGPCATCGSWLCINGQPRPPCGCDLSSSPCSTLGTGWIYLCRLNRGWLYTQAASAPGCAIYSRRVMDGRFEEDL